MGASRSMRRTHATSGVRRIPASITLVLREHSSHACSDDDQAVALCTPGCRPVHPRLWPYAV
jgi:hypothetical protein